MPEFAPYCASKHALIGLVRSAALEYAGRLRANAVAPATTDTPMVARFAERWPEWQARFGGWKGGQVDAVAEGSGGEA
jgi:NAD(P)-dependent dehydrogenase (short-subunit alcohol dehydrogenase family)